MAFLSDATFDAALAYVVANGTRLDICSAEPTSYAQATASLSLGSKSGVSVGSPANRSGGGREVVIPALSAGTVTATGSATHWALSDGATLLIATGALTVPVAVTSGNTFSTAPFAIGVLDAT